MNLFEITSEEEYNELKGMYQSEGFSIYLRLLDSLVGSLYNKAIDDKTRDEQIISSMHTIKGLTMAKNTCYNALKENEVKFGREEIRNV